jgi:hypothetical protein
MVESVSSVCVIISDVKYNMVAGSVDVCGCGCTVVNKVLVVCILSHLVIYGMNT